MIVALRRLALTALVLALPALAGAQTYTISPPPFLLAQNNSGAIINNGCVWTYVAGTTTPATTYTTSTGTPNANPIRSDSAGRFTAYLQPGVSYKFVYEAACTPPAHGTVLRTADNISAMPASASTTDVTGTAGESITAGQCVYLSDGSGSKTPAQWYKCDSATAYSSTANVVGIATVNIASAGTGTIRLAGSVTGLSALTPGAPYYVGTSGALTATAPTNKRIVGQADSATSLVVTADPPIFPIVPAQAGVVCGRLTGTTGVPITTADATAVTTLFFAPLSSCNQITLFNGAQNVTYTFTQISIAVPATTSQLYDVFVYDNAGTATLELVAWTNDTTRAATPTIQNGFLAKSTDATRRYVGNMRTTTVSGQTEDSVANVYIWNYYNRIGKDMHRTEAATTWTYNTTAIHQANANAANQLNFIIGWSEDQVLGHVQTAASNATAGTPVAVGIGVDSTSTFAPIAYAGGQVALSNAPMPFAAVYRGYPGIGKHSLMWNEWVTAAGGNTTFYNNATQMNISEIDATVMH